MTKETENTETVGERLYPVPALHDVELRELADRMIMMGMPASKVKGMTVAELAALAQEAARDTEGDT
jgi:hypothetical protein